MNQLQSLLQDSLIATGNVDNCAIVRKKDVSLRASSSGFTLSTSDIEDLVEAFKHPTQTREDGVQLHGIKYKCDDVGLVLVKTASLILVGTYNKDMYQSICVEAMEKLADYFREKGK
ncbi:profilin-4-like isoform X2 [Rhopilema esculentum]|uniref:profilin-4-like isoform X2 n=1 Tax=Rhopilema esculentum TaxID=499914 RepID=UPI0031DECA93